MNAYSVDLRERIVAAVTSGMSRPDALRTFQISAATLGRYLKQHRESGDLTPRRHTAGRQPHIAPEQYAALRELIAATPDATLAETCHQWQQRTGVLVSQATMCRALAQIGWTRKKKSSGKRTRRGTALRLSLADAATRRRSLRDYR
jgi:transposase